MKRDSRLSGVLHILLHMAQQDGPLTSEILAKAMATNPAVIRRLMAGLRDAGYVRSEKGHGGGWTLACDLSAVTLRDIYTALGSPTLLAMGNRTETPDCLVEAAVNAALRTSFQDAEALLLARLGAVTLAMLRDDIHHRRAARVGSPPPAVPAAHTSHAHTGPHTRDQMHPLQTGLLMTTIGGACSPTSPPAAAPPEHGSADDAHAHHHQGKADPHTDHGGVELHHRFTDAEKWTSVFDDPARDAWQQPDAVLRAMALEPTMTVADIGAGTGYFSVRLARAVPSGAVIATDIEPDMVRYLGERAAREQLPNLRALLSTPTASGLTAQSVDRILIVDVWHHIADRVGYARDLAAALRPDGRLFIVDFSLAAQHGPPASMRLPPEAIIADLTTAGMTASVSPVALPDQYIIEASLTP